MRLARTLLALTLLVTFIGSPLAWGDDIVSTAAATGNFRTLVNLLVLTGLDDALSAEGHYTVFAPSDDAFNHLPSDTLDSLRRPENRDQLKAILKYHVVDRALQVPRHPPSHPITEIASLEGSLLNFSREGSQVRVNDARIVDRNIHCANGVIQVIDAVLLPPQRNTLADVAAARGQFHTLIRALEATDLLDAIRGTEPLTVFAPTDEAFAALGQETLDQLLKEPGQEQLTQILKRHVISGAVNAAELVRQGKATTLAGNELTISIEDGRLRVDAAGLQANDIAADNGVIHVIDTVLVPETANATSAARRPRIVEIAADWREPVIQDGIDAELVRISSKGGGSVRLTNIRADRIESIVRGGSRVEIQGDVGQHQSLVLGGAELAAAKLRSGITKVAVRGGGEAVINASDLLEVSAAAGARIRYLDNGVPLVKDLNRYAQLEAFPADGETAH